MISSLRPTWRDYVATADIGDGKTEVLGVFSAKVGYAFEVACSLWPDEFIAGRGRIKADEKAATVDRFDFRGRESSADGRWWTE